MAKFKNVSPLGALDIPVLGRIVEAGEVFEVSNDMTQHFADQTANFKRIKASRAPGGAVAPSGADDSTDEKEEDR